MFERKLVQFGPKTKTKTTVKEVTLGTVVTVVMVAIVVTVVP